MVSLSVSITVGTKCRTDRLGLDRSCLRQERSLAPLAKKRRLVGPDLGSALCRCSGCKGEDEHGALADVRQKPGQDVLCKWCHKHWAYMQKHGLDPEQVASFYQQRLPKGHRMPHLSPRAQHVLDISVYKQPLVRLVDLSQSVDRAASSTGPAMGCITPGGAFFSVKANRLLTPGEKMIMKSLPIHLMDMGCNTGAEVESMAGNAMHVKA